MDTPNNDSYNSLPPLADIPILDEPRCKEVAIQYVIDPSLGPPFGPPVDSQQAKANPAYTTPQKPYKAVRCVDYLARALNPATLPKLVDDVVTKIEETKIEFDTIAFRGLSGTLVAPLVAVRMNKQMIAVRKATNDCHSSYSAEGYIESRRYIVVDDLTATGDTLLSIRDEVDKTYDECAIHGRATMVAAFTYQELAYGPGDEDAYYTRYLTPAKWAIRDGSYQVRTPEGYPVPVYGCRKEE